MSDDVPFINIETWFSITPQTDLIFRHYGSLSQAICNQQRKRYGLCKFCFKDGFGSLQTLDRWASPNCDEKHREAPEMLANPLGSPDVSLESSTEVTGMAAGKRIPG